MSYNIEKNNQFLMFIRIIDLKPMKKIYLEKQIKHIINFDFKI